MEAGAPEMLARILSDTDAGVANGALFDNGGDACPIDRAADHSLPNHDRGFFTQPQCCFWVACRLKR